MDKETVKMAYKEAENSLKDKQIEEVKKIVLKTLEKIESLKTEKEKSQERVKELDETIKLLKMDIDDLKEGRLDRIEERQAKDEKAKESSVVIIIKETRVEHDYPFWHWPYRIVWPIHPAPWTLWCTATTSDYTNTDTTYGYVDCSSAKWATPGAYQLTSGTINIR